MKQYIYTFIRKDISPEQRIVQLGHATWEAGLRFECSGPECHLILLSARDEQDLKAISRKLDMRGMEHYMFFEPDDNMGFSAICTRPIIRTDERNFFKRYSLYSA